MLSYLNESLDILDLGCGTGLVGSWFRDYARKLVGVDISPTMLDMATKKGCYHELRRGVSDFFFPLTSKTATFLSLEPHFEGFFASHNHAANSFRLKSHCKLWMTGELLPYLILIDRGV